MGGEGFGCFGELAAGGFEFGPQVGRPVGTLAHGSCLPRGYTLGMPAGSNAKRERQYEDIEQSLEERGRPKKVAQEIAARTVNKARARAGESKEASKTSLDDISSSRRGGLRSHQGAQGRTRDQLYEEAKRKNIEGRSKMSKAELEKAVDRKK